jgi:hypothetical protein
MEYPHSHPRPEQCPDSKIEDVINYVLSLTDRLNRRLRELEAQLAAVEGRLQRLEQGRCFPPPDPLFPSPPFPGFNPYDTRDDTDMAVKPKVWFVPDPNPDVLRPL